MLKRIGKVLKCSRGQGLVEYAMIVIVVAVTLIFTVTPLGDALKTAGNSVKDVILQKITELQSTTGS